MLVLGKKVENQNKKLVFIIIINECNVIYLLIYSEAESIVLKIINFFFYSLLFFWVIQLFRLKIKHKLCATFASWIFKKKYNQLKMQINAKKDLLNLFIINKLVLITKIFIWNWIPHIILFNATLKHIDIIYLKLKNYINILTHLLGRKFKICQKFYFKLKKYNEL